MLDRIKFGEYDVICDKCGKKEKHYVTEGFLEMTEDLKNNGWEFTDNGEHFCPDCMED